MASSDFEYRSFPASDTPETTELQDCVEAIFTGHRYATSLELLTRAEICDLGEKPMEVVSLLPAGRYTRRQMAEQLNSIICAHAWSRDVGLVD